MTIQVDLTPDLLAILGEQSPRKRQPAAAEVAVADQAELAELELADSSHHEPASAEPTTTADSAAAPSPRARVRGLGRRQGVAELLDNGPVDPALVADLLTDPDGLPVGIRRVQRRRICLDPAGQGVAVDDRTAPLEGVLATQPDRAQLLRQLITALPAPPLTTNAYEPSAAQSRVVRARDTTCTFPGCARRARRCELDHRNRYRDGGPTSVSNLHPLCKHHPRLKHDGWTCTRDEDGTTSWTSPRGQRLRC